VSNEGEAGASSPVRARSTPTPKMLSLARTIAGRLGVELTEAQENEFDACRDFLDQHSDSTPPSQKQIAYAERLSRETGEPLPADARTNWRVMREWLDKQAQGAGGSR